MSHTRGEQLRNLSNVGILLQAAGLHTIHGDQVLHINQKYQTVGDAVQSKSDGLRGDVVRLRPWTHSVWRIVGLEKESNDRNPPVTSLVVPRSSTVFLLSSSAVEFEALLPSIEYGLVVLAPLAHDPFIPVLARLGFDALPVHLLIVGIKGEIKPILIGQPIVVKIVSRCRIVGLVMGLEQGFVVHERVGFVV